MGMLDLSEFLVVDYKEGGRWAGILISVRYSKIIGEREVGLDDYKQNALQSLGK